MIMKQLYKKKKELANLSEIFKMFIIKNTTNLY